MGELKAINGYQGQITSDKFGENIYENIMNMSNLPLDTQISFSIIRLGIQANPGDEIFLNNIPIIIGKTGFYEINDVKITEIRLGEVLDKTDILFDFILG